MARQAMCRSSSLRNVIPVFVGFLIGSILSVIIFPTVEDAENSQCSKNDVNINFRTLKGDSRLNSIGGGVGKLADATSYSPIPAINNATPSKLMKSKSSRSTSTKTVVKPNRPRFVATELGIKDKLLVGVVTSRENLATIATAINKTVAHHVSKLIFFVDSPGSSTTARDQSSMFLNLVNIAAGTPDNLKLFAILNHMAGRGQALAKNYDWFFIMPDAAYLKAFKLYELVSHISFGYNVQMGRPWKETGSGDGASAVYCDFNAGILISFGLMRSLLANLRQCMKNIDPTRTASENFGRCVLLANKNAVCSEEWNGKAYRSWLISKSSPVGVDLSELSKHDQFNSALTVYPIGAVSDVFRLHKYYCDQEIEQINQLIGTVEQSLLNSVVNSTETEFAWPPGISSFSRPRSRYELLKWDYFTRTDIFENNNDRNVDQLMGVNEKDVKEVVDYAVHGLLEKYTSLKFDGLLNGYRRFDPKRGMDYILDLMFASNGQEVEKRVHLIRPLNKIELVPAPYVTESSSILIVVPVVPADRDVARGFLERFIKVSLDVNENAKVMLVLFYETTLEQASYEQLKNEMDTARKKYKGETKSSVDYIQIRSSTPSQFLMIDLVSQTVGPDHLYLIVTPWTEIYGDFLNRVRMNTIKEFQIFTPIPFVQFNPKIVNGQKSRPAGTTQEHIDVHKNIGRFDYNDFSMVSFYGTDYTKRRRQFGETGEHLYFEHDLISIFFNSTIHLFRAIEPALKIRYHEKWCDPKVSKDLYETCSCSRKEGMGTKAQLANLLMEYGAFNDPV